MASTGIASHAIRRTIGSAIERHKEAFAAFVGAIDDDAGPYDLPDQETTRALNDAENDVCACPCRTMGEVRAKAEYLLGESMFRHCIPDAQQMKAILLSLAAAD